jgi:hypothetical protein
MFLRILALIGEAPNQTKSSTESEADPFIVRPSSCRFGPHQHRLRQGRTRRTPFRIATLGNPEPLLSGVLGSDQADGRLSTNVRCTSTPVVRRAQTAVVPPTAGERVKSASERTNAACQ